MRRENKKRKVTICEIGLIQVIITQTNGEGSQYDKLEWSDPLYLVAFSSAKTLLSNSEIFFTMSTFDRIGSGNAPSDLGAGHSYPPIIPFLVTVSEIFSVELLTTISSETAPGLHEKSMLIGFPLRFPKIRNL